jgi:hypothetical protein
MGRYRFGPLGRLMVVEVDLARTSGEFDAPVEEIGGLHESLNGTRTKDVLGRKASFRIRIEGMDPRALSWFEMAYHGGLGSPLYFVDEDRINRMGAAESSALSVWAEIDPFTHLSGTHITVLNTALLLPGVQDGEAVQTPGPAQAVSWTNASTQNLIRCGPMLPVQPGEHVAFSVYVLSTTGGTPQTEFTPYDAAGVALPQVATSSAVTPGPPDRYQTSYVVPGSGVAALQPCIRHVAAQTTVFTALQLEAGDMPTPWVLGQGCPKVLVDTFPLTRHRLGNRMDGHDLVLAEV